MSLCVVQKLNGIGMNNLSTLLSDPVVWISALGLTSVLAICTFYVFFS